MSSTTTPFMRTLSMSNTCFTSTLHNPSFFIQKSHLLSLPIKPTKLPFCLSLKKPTFSSTVVSYVAQTSDWEQEGSNTVLEEGSDQEVPNWGTQDFGGSEGQISDFGSSGDEVEGDGFTEPPEDAKLFVGNLPYDVDSEKLAQIFEGAGIVEIAEVIYNRETERSRGFGFVTMSTVEEAEKAVEMFNRYM